MAPILHSLLAVSHGEALLLLKGEETEERSGRMEGKDETRGSLIDDRCLPLICYLSSAQRVVTASAQAPAHQDDTGPCTHTKWPARGLGTPEGGGCWGNVQLRLAKCQGRQRAWLTSCVLPVGGGYRGNMALQSTRGNTFLTSAILSFLEAGFSLVSGGVCWDFEPVDSLSDSD